MPQFPAADYETDNRTIRVDSEKHRTAQAAKERSLLSYRDSHDRGALHDPHPQRRVPRWCELVNPNRGVDNKRRLREAYEEARYEKKPR